MIVVWILLGVVIVVAVIAIGSYNGLIRARNQVENAWSQIDVQLKRRLDLVPNLVETVKGYATHEQVTLDSVIQARNSAVSAASTPSAQGRADTTLTGALRQVFALSEAYPELRANQNFLVLQEELAATEGRIGYARQFYNDAVLSHNDRIQTFPSAILASMMTFDRREYFQADESARQSPSVAF